MRIFNKNILFIEVSFLVSQNLLSAPCTSINLYISQLISMSIVKFINFVNNKKCNLSIYQLVLNDFGQSESRGPDDSLFWARSKSPRSVLRRLRNFFFTSLFSFCIIIAMFRPLCSWAIKISQCKELMFT